MDWGGGEVEGMVRKRCEEDVRPGRKILGRRNGKEVGRSGLNLGRGGIE